MTHNSLGRNLPMTRNLLKIIAVLATLSLTLLTGCGPI